MAQYQCDITVKRKTEHGELVTKVISSDDLVPGDIFIVPEFTKMPCDAILLSGAVIVNESMLTGESIPVFKTRLPKSDSDIYDPDKVTQHTLYSGTEVIQCRKVDKGDVTAVVIRTSFTTTKGSLIKSILYPKPSRFNFYNDAMKFICIMGILAMLGWVTTIDASLKYLSWGETINRFADLITTTVSPTLPTAMSLGIMFAIHRLKNKHIFCISPNKIDVAGRATRIVFDKTGTLTEEGLNVAGHKCMKTEKTFHHLVENSNQLFEEHDIYWRDKESYSAIKNTYRMKYLECMAACHMVAKVGDVFIGDPLDIEMFKHTEWIIDESEETNQATEEPDIVTYYPKELETIKDRNNSYKIGIVKRFDFSSALQCMSVVARNSYDDSLVGFIKGSPEKIEAIAFPESIPENFRKILQVYTQDGLRVLALAYKYLPDVTYASAKDLKRDDIESNVVFLGFLVMQNMVKPATMKCLMQLQNAAIETYMATGDNGLTAVSVGRE